MTTTRRTFLKAGALSAAGVLFASKMQAFAGVDIKLSACDWSMQLKNQPDGLEVAKDIGLNGVEISAATEALDTLVIADPAFRAAYKEAMERTGMVVSSVAMGLLNEYPFAEDVRAPAWLEQTIEGAADLNAKVILLAFFGKGDLLAKRGLLGGGGDLKEKELDVVVERLKDAAPKAAEAGVIIGLENTLSGAQNLAILDRVQSDVVQVYYDTGNSTYNGYDVPAEIRDLNDRICQIHFKDGAHALGEGRVDMDAVAEAMTAINYKGWVTLETAIRDQNRDESFRKNIQFVRNLFNLA